jgi:hypothetical protein
VNAAHVSGRYSLGNLDGAIKAIGGALDAEKVWRAEPMVRPSGPPTWVMRHADRACFQRVGHALQGRHQSGLQEAE